MGAADSAAKLQSIMNLIRFRSTLKSFSSVGASCIASLKTSMASFLIYSPTLLSLVLTTQLRKSQLRPYFDFLTYVQNRARCRPLTADAIAELLANSVAIY